MASRGICCDVGDTGFSLIWHQHIGRCSLGHYLIQQLILDIKYCVTIHRPDLAFVLPDLVMCYIWTFQLHVHTIVLSLAVPEIDWTKNASVLDGLPEDVTHAILHWLYSESLPRGLSEDTARRASKAVAKVKGFEKFTQMCETFLKNTALKQRKCAVHWWYQFYVILQMLNCS